MAGTESRPNTPITPFSPRSPLTSPRFKDVEIQYSQLLIALDFATPVNNVIKYREVIGLGWLNLIEHDKERYGLQQNDNELTSEESWCVYKSLFPVSPRKQQISCATEALDLATPTDPEVTSEDGNQGRTSTIPEWLDLHQVQGPESRGKSAEDERSAQDDDAPDVEEGAEIGEKMRLEKSTRDKETTAAKDTTSTSDSNSALEHIDLDAVFGGAADDLYEDYEAEKRATRANIHTPAHESIVSPAHASEEEAFSSNTSIVSINTHHSSSNHETNVESTSLEQFAPAKAEEVADWYVTKWEKLCAATQRAKVEGRYEHKSLQAADRSVDWLWEPTNEDNRHQYDPRIFSAAAEPASNHGGKSNITSLEKCIRHLNYLRQPVFHKSDTPPEVSLWAVCSGFANGHHPSFSRQGVVSSQAGKLIDPFWYSGPSELLKYRGTKLRDEVTGYVAKVYHPIGTWILDQYSWDEIVPQIASGEEYTDFYNAVGYPFYPQPTYCLLQAKEIRRSTNGTVPLYPDGVDLEDPIINDDGRPHINKPKRDRDWVLPPPSRLVIVRTYTPDVSDSEPLPAKPKQIELPRISHSQIVESILPEQSEEEVAAEDEDFYSGAAVSNSPNLAEAETIQQISNELAVTHTSNLAEAEEAEQCSDEESNDSEASTVISSQRVRDFFESPELILTERHIQAITDGREDEASNILTRRIELLANVPASATEDTQEVSGEEAQIDYIDMWVTRTMRLVFNEDYSSRWSESAAAEARVDGVFPEEEDLTMDEVDCCSLSPVNIDHACPTRSSSLDRFTSRSYEEVSKDMGNDLVLNEDTQELNEQDHGDDATSLESEAMDEYDVDVMSVSSEKITNMSTENLDNLLSEVSCLLASRLGSETEFPGSSADKDPIERDSDSDDPELDREHPAQEQLAEQKAQLASEAQNLAGREQKVVEREAKLAAEEKKLAAKEKELAQKERDLAEATKVLAEEKAQPAAPKASDSAADHVVHALASPSAVPPSPPSFPEHFFGSFAIAVGGRASRLALGLARVLRSSARVLHRR